MAYNYKYLLSRAATVSTPAGEAVGIEQITEVIQFDAAQTDAQLIEHVRICLSGWRLDAVRDMWPHRGEWRIINSATTPPLSAPGGALAAVVRNDPSPSAVSALRDAINGKQRFIAENTDDNGEPTIGWSRWDEAIANWNETIAERAENI